MQFCDTYSKFFVVRGKDVSGHARSYLTGLLGKQQRKNIGQVSEDVVASNYQGMQQMVSDSPWDHEGLMGEIACKASQLLGGHRDSALYLDETSFVKKGEASVGVQRQYCGRLGKIENCQMGVFSSLGRGNRAILIDFRLFLPESWAQDSKRCDKAKVPLEKRHHQTKCELALEMVKKARAAHISYQWIGGDEVYGNNHEFTSQLEDLGETFLMDVASNCVVWDQDPQPRVSSPQYGTKKSRGVPSNNQALQSKVCDLASREFENQSKVITLRKTTKADLTVRLWIREVWVWEPRYHKAPRRRLLVVRQESDGSFKYSLTNAPDSTSWSRLGFMQSQRYFIERAFQDAKTELGMAHYEVRTWRGWHHHIALCCLAMLFCLQERLAYTEELPLLSVADIVDLLDYFLPRKSRDLNMVMNNIAHRHRQRENATNFFRKRKT